MDISHTLIALGLLILVMGLAWPLVNRLGLGRLPGDIVIQRGNFTFYLPVVTGLLLSVILSVALREANR